MTGKIKSTYDLQPVSEHSADVLFSTSDRTGDLYKQRHGEKKYSFLQDGREKLFYNFLKEKRHILDMGCRTGSNVIHFATDRITGIDIDDNALRVCKKSTGIEVLKADAFFKLPIKDKTFDGIILGEIIEHVPFINLFLSEISRILKDDGRVVGSVPNSYRLRNRIRVLFGKGFDEDWMHLHYLNRNMLHDHLSSFFSDIEILAINGKLTEFTDLFSSNLMFKAEGKINR